MYEKINERSESMIAQISLFFKCSLFIGLDQIIDDFAELIRAHYDISELGDPSSSTDVRERLISCMNAFSDNK